MKKEVIWVEGLSAAGKEMFIRKIVEDKPSDLLRQFGWFNKKIALSHISLAAIGSLGDRSAKANRAAIEEEVMKLANVYDVILIKGQSLDTEAKRQKKIEKILPDFQHKIIVIRVKDEDMAERLMSKPWWNKSEDPLEWAEAERGLVDEEIKSLAKDFEIININGNKNSNYEIIKQSD